MLRIKPQRLVFGYLPIRCFSKCWKCNKDFQSIELECNKCGYLQPPDSSIKKHNFFSLLSIPEQYLVDKKLIDTRCRDFQKKYHPDLFSSKSSEPELHKYANGFSVYLNEARTVLLNDMNRMTYMLELKGLKMQGLDDQTGIDPSFLAEIFEIQQEMQTTTSTQDLSDLKQKIIEHSSRLQNSFMEYYDKGQYEQARTVALKYKYYETSLQNLLRKKASLHEMGLPQSGHSA